LLRERRAGQREPDDKAQSARIRVVTKLVSMVSSSFAEIDVGVLPSCPPPSGLIPAIMKAPRYLSSHAAYRSGLRPPARLPQALAAIELGEHLHWNSSAEAEAFARTLVEDGDRSSG